MAKMLRLKNIIDESLRDPEFAEAFRRELLINEIAQLVVEMRQAANLTQVEMAERAHTQQPVIARIESGTDSRIPSLELLVRLAHAANKHLTLGVE